VIGASLLVIEILFHKGAADDSETA
jgi:hypothetical protein